MSINIDINAICPGKVVHVLTLFKNVIADWKAIDEDGNESVIAISPFKEELGATIYDGSEYTIVLNTTKMSSLLEASWLRDCVDLNMIKNAILLHELAHVNFTDFESTVASKSKIKALIHNILEDTRIEYVMTYDFPETSIFFNVLLSIIKSSFATGAGLMSTPFHSKEALDKLVRLINCLYMFARYNLVEKDVDKDFIGNIIPLVLFARRGTQHDCDVATEVIANIISNSIMDASEDIDIAKPHVVSITEPITPEQQQELQEQSGDTSMQEVAKQFFNASEVKEKLEKHFDLQAGTKSVIENKQHSKFFVDTVLEFGKEIEQLRQTFKRAFTDFKNVCAKDGDINFMRQQEAYMNSITGEEGNDFQYRKLERVLVDVVVLRDVSGSIAHVSKEYAQAIVMLLSALENIEGIRTSQIDFNGSHYVNKTFDSRIEKATINPFASGGTSIRGAYEEVLKYNFKGKKNIVIVFSDGDVSESKQKVEELEAKIKQSACLLKYGIGNYARNGHVPIKISDIPRELMKAIIKEGL